MGFTAGLDGGLEGKYYSHILSLAKCLLKRELSVSDPRLREALRENKFLLS